MKLEPINPQEFTDYVAYSEKKRTRWERFLDKIKPRSAAMRTTVLVVFVVLFSLFMSLWFFWRTLYLPEIQQHARYLAVELEIINNPELKIFHGNQELDTDEWLKHLTTRAKDLDFLRRVLRTFSSHWPASCSASFDEMRYRRMRCRYESKSHMQS